VKAELLGEGEEGKERCSYIEVEVRLIRGRDGLGMHLATSDVLEKKCENDCKKQGKTQAKKNGKSSKCSITSVTPRPPSRFAASPAAAAAAFRSRHWIESVVPGGAAARTGKLRRMDTLVEVDGRPVHELHWTEMLVLLAKPTLLLVFLRSRSIASPRGPEGSTGKMKKGKKRKNSGQKKHTDQSKRTEQKERAYSHRQGVIRRLMAMEQQSKAQEDLIQTLEECVLDAPMLLVGAMD
jgi:hypothetical protein